MTVYFWSIFLLCVLITNVLHEGAHLLVARLVGCHVEVFSIGFGNCILWQKTHKGTVYQLTPILLGGHCDLYKELEASDEPQAFTHLPYSRKVLISIAGVLTNILVGVVSFILGTYFQNYNFWIFGIVSLVLGLSNTLPIPPLDGSYPF